MDKQYTGIYPTDKFDFEFVSKIESICASIRSAGLDPYSQLTGYLLTGEDRYITRTNNARSLIASLDHSTLQMYVKMYLEK